MGGESWWIRRAAPAVAIADEATRSRLVQKADEAPRSRFAQKADLTLVKMKETVAGIAAKKTDNVVHGTTRWFVKKLGRFAKDSMVPSHLPSGWQDPWQGWADTLWARLEDELMRAIVLSNKFSGPEGEYRELRAQYWAKAFPTNSGCWAWARARLLHALNPADENVFKSLRDPFVVLLLLLRMCPFYGISIIVYCLKFFIIDRTDEFQLVNFVLEFKGYQFLSSGVLVACTLGYQAALCVVHEHGGGHVDRMSDACLRTAPGQMFDFEFWFELWLQPVRIVLVYYATILLLAGRAHGGYKELHALEACRLDAADGVLDGDADRQYLRLLRNQCERTYEIELEEMEVYLEKHRLMHNTSTRHGGALWRFVVYDALMLCVVVGGLFLMSGFFLAIPPSDALFWTLVYYGNCLYSLATFPFLVFKVPVVGELLHGAMPTGYDKMGMLVPQLSWLQLKEKVAADELAVQEAKKASSARRKYSAGEVSKPYEVDRQVAELQRRRQFAEAEEVARRRIIDERRQHARKRSSAGGAPAAAAHSSEEGGRVMAPATLPVPGGDSSGAGAGAIYTAVPIDDPTYSA